MVQGGVLDWHGGATTCNLLCANSTASFNADERINTMLLRQGVFSACCVMEPV